MTTLGTVTLQHSQFKDDVTIIKNVKHMGVNHNSVSIVVKDGQDEITYVYPLSSIYSAIKQSC